MDGLPKLNFPAVRLRARRTADGVEVWDPVRGMWLVLTPEEWVRRHLIGWLAGRGVAPQRIVQEWPVKLNGQPQRADVVAVDRQGRPQLLAECKAASVKIDGTVLDQAVRYNSVVGAPCLMLTNGLTHYFYLHEEGRYRPAQELPAWLVRNFSDNI